MKHEILQMQTQGGDRQHEFDPCPLDRPMAMPNMAAKHRLIGLIKTAALEYADDQIRVNAVCPGFIRTPMTAETQITTRPPPGRFGKPYAAEISRVALMGNFSTLHSADRFASRGRARSVSQKYMLAVLTPTSSATSATDRPRLIRASRRYRAKFGLRANGLILAVKRAAA